MTGGPVEWQARYVGGLQVRAVAMHISWRLWMGAPGGPEFHLGWQGLHCPHVEPPLAITSHRTWQLTLSSSSTSMTPSRISTWKERRNGRQSASLATVSSSVNSKSIVVKGRGVQAAAADATARRRLWNLKRASIPAGRNTNHGAGQWRNQSTASLRTHGRFHGRLKRFIDHTCLSKVRGQTSVCFSEVRCSLKMRVFI